MEGIISVIEEAGYNPYEQLYAYLRTGNENYITRKGDARAMVAGCDRSKIWEYIEPHIQKKGNRVPFLCDLSARILEFRLLSHWQAGQTDTVQQSCRLRVMIEHTKEGPILYDRPLSYYIDLAWAEAEPIALAKRYGVQKTDRMVMHDNDKTVTVVFSDSARNDSWSEIHVTLTPQSDGSYAVDSSLTTATSEAELQMEIDSSIEAVRTQTAIANLFAEIESSPAYSSNPKDYIDAHPDAYQKFVEYGNHSLIFIFNEFLGGGQPGLHGHILCSVMTELLNENEIIKCNAVNGQDYFDHWLASARSVGEQHDAA